MPTFIDQLGHEIHLKQFPPQRIVSLVPSQTELLCDLGLTEQVVGITKFCVHPETWISSKQIIGGTKKFDFRKIDQLNPELIIGNKEENYQEGIARLKEKYPVWMSDIVTIEDALKMILNVGEMVDRKQDAEILFDEIWNEFVKLVKVKEQKSALYLIWYSPWMAAGSSTFINSILKKIGLKNAIHYQPRYPELSQIDIRELSPDLIFLSSEPYPFKEKHVEELREISPASKIMQVDGEMFSWYGSRLLKAPAYLKDVIAEVNG
ncbi:MAG: helical backbone metal receptor [Flammeovirgaceae bacterium]|nr:helical backbone metal receptor [Flammeovirgaceae bacterium]